jgi:hypothetical protein
VRHYYLVALLYSPLGLRFLRIQKDRSESGVEQALVKNVHVTKIKSAIDGSTEALPALNRHQHCPHDMKFAVDFRI